MLYFKMRHLKRFSVFAFIALCVSLFQNCASDFNPEAYNNSASETVNEGAGPEITGPPLVAPTLLTRTSNLSIQLGQPAVMSVTATGGGLTYLWKKDGVTLSNNTDTLFIVGTVATDAGTYTLDVINTIGVVSIAYTLAFVNPAEVGPPVIVTPPANQFRFRALNGLISPVTFQVVARGQASLTYQWYVSRNGGAEILIVGATASTYSVTSSGLGVHTYRVVVTNPLGTATASAILEVEVIDLR
jgi:hypothetical protein